MSQEELQKQKVNLRANLTQRNKHDFIGERRRTDRMNSERKIQNIKLKLHKNQQNDCLNNVGANVDSQGKIKINQKLLQRR